jgi:hypothetical protein
LKNSGICAKYIDWKARLAPPVRNYRQLIPNHKSANVTPFDIIINTDENAREGWANSQQRMRLSEREMLY